MFVLGLTLLVAVGLALRIAILDEYLHENPIAERPWMDGWIYWQMAARMADGHWLAKTPFQSAPLYPYLLGVIRSLGGGLLTVYVVQLVMHLATSVIIAHVTRLRFGVATGLLAAALFLALTEPAVVSTRVFSENLTVLLVVLVWWRWMILVEKGRRRDVIGTGVLIGLLTLAYPPAILLVPTFGLFLWVNGGWRHGLLRALGGILSAIVMISPATIHNAVVGGEFVPVTVHAGITLRQGNGEKACGYIHAIPGVSPRRDTMHEAAAAVFRTVHGRDGTWAEIDRYYRGEVFDYWRRHPLDTARLFGRKAWLFLTSQEYGDMLSITVERSLGLSGRAILAPLPVAWLMGAALAGLIAVLRRPLRFAPEWILALLPLVVVVLFFYTPRYRLPAVPLLCALAAYTLVYCRRFRVATVVVLGVCVLPLPLQVLNGAYGFDASEQDRVRLTRSYSEAQVLSANKRVETDRLAEAEQRFRSAIELWEGNESAHDALARLYLRTRRPEHAAAEWSRTVQLNPRNLDARRNLYTVLCGLRRYRDARDTLRELLRSIPRDTAARLSLAWLLATCPNDSVRDGTEAVALAQAEASKNPGRQDVLNVLAAAQAENGAFDQAVATSRAALSLARAQHRDQLAQRIRRRIAAYREHRPWRGPPRPLKPR